MPTVKTPKMVRSEVKERGPAPAVTAGSIQSGAASPAPAVVDRNWNTNSVVPVYTINVVNEQEQIVGTWRVLMPDGDDEALAILGSELTELVSRHLARYAEWLASGEPERSAACVERERLSAPAIEPNLALAGAEAPEADYPQAPGTEYGTCVRVQMTDELDATDNDQVIGEWLLVGGKDLKAVAVANLNALAADFADAFAERMRMATKRGVPLTTAMQEAFAERLRAEAKGRTAAAGGGV
jgi:hypothetical protein